MNDLSRGDVAHSFGFSPDGHSRRSTLVGAMQLFRSGEVFERLLADLEVSSSVRAYSNQYHNVDSLEVLSRIDGANGTFRAKDESVLPLKQVVLFPNRVLKRSGGFHHQGKWRKPVIMFGADNVAAAFKIYRPRAILHLLSGYYGQLLARKEFEPGVPMELQVYRCINEPQRPRREGAWHLSLEAVLRHERLRMMVISYPIGVGYTERWGGVDGTEQRLFADLDHVAVLSSSTRLLPESPAVAKAICRRNKAGDEVVVKRRINSTSSVDIYQALPPTPVEDLDQLVLGFSYQRSPSYNTARREIQEALDVALVAIQRACVMQTTLSVAIGKMYRSAMGNRPSLPNNVLFDAVSRKWVVRKDMSSEPRVLLYGSCYAWYNNERGKVPKLAMPAKVGWVGDTLVMQPVAVNAPPRPDYQMLPRNSSRERIGTPQMWLEWQALNQLVELHADTDRNLVPYVINNCSGDAADCVRRYVVSTSPWHLLLYRVRGLSPKDTRHAGFKLASQNNMTTTDLAEAITRLSFMTKTQVSST